MDALNGMNSNPLFSDQETSPPVSPRLSSSTSSSDLDDDVPAVTPPASVLQTINIKSHVPIVLDLANPNYAQWHTFFDSVVGKFGLGSHIAVSPTPAQRHNAEWRVIDQCLVNWIFLTISTDVLDVVRRPHNTAYSVWHAIENEFRDNELH